MSKTKANSKLVVPTPGAIFINITAAKIKKKGGGLAWVKRMLQERTNRGQFVQLASRFQTSAGDFRRYMGIDF